ncbi:hypothetical protein L596_009510 [Steinernema carpocapsae]|uniref:Uncharacterized protein n=1 Tax=Steinernema carpocapsae TaxID=34508 RepID=A0A4U5PG24_STECR|nr:hypothetical protein L596_009510 [Steinernema carpocapsae]
MTERISVSDHIQEQLRRSENACASVEARLSISEDRFGDLERRRERAENMLMGVLNEMSSRVSALQNIHEAREASQFDYISLSIAFIQTSQKIISKERSAEAVIQQPIPTTTSVSVTFKTPTEVFISCNSVVTSNKSNEIESACLTWLEKQCVEQKSEATYREPPKPIKPWRRSLQPWKRGKDVSKIVREITFFLNNCTLKKCYADKLMGAWNKNINFVHFTCSQILNRVQKEPMLARLYVKVLCSIFAQCSLKLGFQKRTNTWRSWSNGLSDVLSTRASTAFMDVLNAKISYSKASKKERDRLSFAYKKTFLGVNLEKYRILDPYLQEAVQEEAARLDKFRRTAMIGYLRLVSELLKHEIVNDTLINEIIKAIQKTKNVEQYEFILKWLQVLLPKMETVSFEDSDTECCPPRKTQKWVKKNPRNLTLNRISARFQAVSDRFSITSIGRNMAWEAVRLGGVLVEPMTDAMDLLMTKYSIELIGHSPYERDFFFKFNINLLIETPWEPLLFLRERLEKATASGNTREIYDVKAMIREIYLGYLRLLEALHKKNLLTRDQKDRLDVLVKDENGDFFDLEYPYMKQIHKHIKTLSESL